MSDDTQRIQSVAERFKARANEVAARELELQQSAERLRERQTQLEASWRQLSALVRAEAIKITTEFRRTFPNGGIKVEPSHLFTDMIGAIDCRMGVGIEDLEPVLSVYLDPAGTLFARFGSMGDGEIINQTVDVSPKFAELLIQLMESAKHRR